MEPDPKNLIVNYIPTPITDADLRRLFEPYGEIESARVIVDRQTLHPKGYGFVKFRDEGCANAAAKAMNGFELLHKRLKVTPARGPQSAKINQAILRSQQQHQLLQQVQVQQQPLQSQPPHLVIQAPQTLPQPQHFAQANGQPIVIVDPSQLAFVQTSPLPVFVPYPQQYQLLSDLHQESFTLSLSRTQGQEQ